MRLKLSAYLVIKLIFHESEGFKIANEEDQSKNSIIGSRKAKHLACSWLIHSTYYYKKWKALANKHTKLRVFVTITFRYGISNRPREIQI